MARRPVAGVSHLVRDAGLTLDGVEMNPEWAEMARPHYRNVWTGTVESAPLPPKHYRLVVCGDVLEHTPDPVAVLRQLRAASTDDAMFIVSVPNIAHIVVRLMLLFGKFGPAGQTRRDQLGVGAVGVQNVEGNGHRLSAEDRNRRIGMQQL